MLARALKEETRCSKAEERKINPSVTSPTAPKSCPKNLTQATGCSTSKKK